MIVLIAFVMVNFLLVGVHDLDISGVLRPAIGWLAGYYRGMEKGTVWAPAMRHSLKEGSLLGYASDIVLRDAI